MAKPNLQERIKSMQELFSDAPDFVVRELIIGKSDAALLYLEGATNKLILNPGVIKPLTDYSGEVDFKNLEDFAKKIIKNNQATATDDEQEYIKNLLDGFSILMFDGTQEVLQIKSDGWINRVPSEPPTSAVVRGPREGFVEDFGINISLMRKRLKTTDFVVKRVFIGKYTDTKVCICYINSIADKKVVKLVEEKLSKINIDGVLDSYYIQTFLEDHTHTIFKQVGYTEKPDIAVAKMLEGRVAIVVDGTPIILTVPFILFEDFQNSNDYYTKSARTTFLRWMRLFSAVIAVLLPGAATAVVLFHYKIIPLKFLITVVNTTQGIPFSPLLEMLFIILLFEILYESSLRMPRFLGLALSVVGALILGDTAVKAGLVSPPAVMIVALTGVMLYCLPEQQTQLSLLRLIFTIVGGTLGIFGIIVGAVFVIAYLANMDSFGAPYLGPFAPYVKNDMQDALTLKPVSKRITRPKTIPNTNNRRLKK